MKLLLLFYDDDLEDDDDDNDYNGRRMAACLGAVHKIRKCFSNELAFKLLTSLKMIALNTLYTTSCSLHCLVDTNSKDFKNSE